MKKDKYIIISACMVLAVLGAAVLTSMVHNGHFAQRKAEQMHQQRIALYMERSKAHELKTKLMYSERLRRQEEYNRMRLLTVTAYSADVAQTDDTPFITASNNRVRPGIVAVSRDLFSRGWVFGRKVYIKGLGIFIIDDLMHARKTNQIDIFMGGKHAALEFGRRKMEVFLLDT